MINQRQIMKRILLSFLALFFPWVIFFMEGKLGLGILAMALQVTFIGWLPMTLVAWRHRANLLPSSKSKTSSVPSDDEATHVDMSEEKE
jgi:hypothetical protein